MCRKIVPLQKSPFRPFCSKRCKMLDLGAWADGEYAISKDTNDVGSESQINYDQTANDIYH